MAAALDTHDQHRAPMLSRLCDTHVHLMDPAFPFVAGRSYTPGAATASMLRAHLASIGAERAVLVQPSVYGVDNDAMLAGLESFGSCTRGIAVVDPGIDSARLEDLAAGGVVGLRMNAETEGLDGEALEERFTALVGACRSADMLLSVHATPPRILHLAPLIRRAGVPIVLEHFALLTRQHRLDAGPADAIRSLLAEGAVWVKLSGISKIAGPPPWQEAVDLIRELVRINPEHLIWGSDWPHTSPGSSRRGRGPEEIERFDAIDDTSVLDVVTRALPASARARVLAKNPQELFRFG